MAAHLKGKRSPTKETRKILVRQIEKALPSLQSRHASDEGIHNARKRIKMARATLRLLRKALSKSQYRAENRSLRDAARPLSDARDTVVLQKTFNDLLKKSPGRAHATCAARFDRTLARERTKSRRAIAGRNGLAQAERKLRDARSQAARWSVPGKGWAVIGAGLKKVYDQGYQALGAVQSSPSDASFHEWRKQAKYLRHQVALLRPVQPKRMDAMAKALHELSDYLGDDHDLAVLRGKLLAKTSQAGDAACQLLCIEIDRRRATLQRQALRLGTRIYKEPARKFHSRLHRYWRDWRDRQ
jgi:CHAD domain-containing protein